ncbi:MAG: TRM11 family methyltransferase, partial [Chloroflexota bacterium]|nr:TRM11 family methyltransferase [Chloroflexota bacterium]
RGLIAVTMLDGDGGGEHLLGGLGYGRMVLRCLGRSDACLAPFDPATTIAGSFAVRVHLLDAGCASNGATARGLEREIGRELWRLLPQPRVDLERPDTEVHVFVTAGGLWWGRPFRRMDGRGFAARHPQRRPFWRSIAMAPRKARCLVNLSGVRPGGSLLDPFCGTGSIPIEAALLGLRTIASDVDPAVVAGAARNVASLGLHQQIDLRHLDARSWGGPRLRFDAIVSDLPYGRSASTKGTDRGDLYRSFLDVAAEILRPGGRAVLMAAEGTLPAPPSPLEVVARFSEVVHGGLTREVVVLGKPGDRSGSDIGWG